MRTVVTEETGNREGFAGCVADVQADGSLTIWVWEKGGPKPTGHLEKQYQNGEWKRVTVDATTD